MLTKMFTRFVTLSFCLILFACSSDKVPLEGERISVMQTRDSIRSDYAPDSVKIVLSEPWENKSWSQKGGNQVHMMGHVASSSKLKEVWDENFGEGDSKRDFLIAEPVISNSAIFAIDAEGIVSAYRLDDGERIWKRRLKPLNRKDKDAAMKGAGLAASGLRLYATTGFGGVFAIDMKTGKIIWKYYADTPIRVAPTVGSGKLFTQTIDNNVIALNTMDGKELWKTKVNSEATILVGGASPAYRADLDVLVAGFNTGELIAFKASTGSVLWNDYLVSRKRTNTTSNITAIKANPVIDGDVVYAAGNNSILAAIDLRSGSRIWEKEIGSVNQPYVSGNYMFVLSDNNDLAAIDKQNGKVIWSINVPTATNLEDKVGGSVSGPLLTGNRLIVATSTGFAFAVSPYTGKILGFINLGRGVALPPIASNNTVIFTSTDARLLAYK